MTTKVAGLTLRNPLIVGSCGLTSQIDSLVKIEENGAGAVVLKSLFEEQIIEEAQHKMKEAVSNPMIYSQQSETLDYLDTHVREETINQYVALLKEAKKKLSIPVIASINCVTPNDWEFFTRQVEDAGADALEINLAIFPAKPDKDASFYENQMIEVVETVKKTASIPVLAKISPLLSNPLHFISRLNLLDLGGIVLFNRFYNPDFNLTTLEEQVAGLFTLPSDQFNTLRWVALSASHVQTPLIASTGIHDAEAVIKQILAGAKAVEVVSTLYQHSIEHLSTITSGIDQWMMDKQYNYIDQFRGKMAASNEVNQSLYQRIQYMKYFGKPSK